MLVTSLGVRAPAWVTAEMIRDAMVHMRSCHPNEGVGFLRASGFVPVKNVAADYHDDQGEPLDPRTAFVIDPYAWVAYDLTNDPVLAVIHSHTNGRSVPGKADMVGQEQSGVPWVILATDGDVVGEPVWFGDQLEMIPLFERPFVHGICDCYSLIRDAFRMGRDGLKAESLPLDQRIYDWPHDPVLLPLGPRDDQWWLNGENFYEEGFAAAGFVELTHNQGELPSDLRVGDCFFARVRSKVPNHAGIYVGNGLILHHLDGYNSHRSVVNIWKNSIERWLRYVPKE